jgi:DNA (cytosine-5)-methyltransferase 1
VKDSDDCIVDNFAGGGGAGLGVRRGARRAADAAINHDPVARAMYQANHPSTRVFLEDIWSVEPRRVTEGRRVSLGWFSPDCTHFSKAKGGKPVSKKIRGLANVVTRWGENTNMSLFILENVEEFQGWGPVSSDGFPIKAREGELFKRWWGELKDDQGFDIEMRLLRGMDYGAPTSRTRLYVIGRRDELPITWPMPSHDGLIRPYRTAAECVDWTIPCPSIFTPGRDLVDNTFRRLAHGVVRYVIDNPRPFIVPLPTSVRAPDRSEQVAAFIARHFGQSVGHRADQPLAATTADGGGHSALVTAHIIKLKGTCRDGQPITQPLHTVQAGGQHYGLVFAFLTKYYGTDQDPRLESPLHTITTKDRFALVTVSVAGETYVIVDIGMRMLTPRELFRAQGFPDSYIIDPLVQDKRVKSREKLIPLPKTGQVRMCGNSVCPDVAEALVAANYYSENRGELAA